MGEICESVSHALRLLQRALQRSGRSSHKKFKLASPVLIISARIVPHRYRSSSFPLATSTRLAFNTFDLQTGLSQFMLECSLINRLEGTGSKRRMDTHCTADDRLCQFASSIATLFIPIILSEKPPREKLLDRMHRTHRMRCAFAASVLI